MANNVLLKMIFIFIFLFVSYLIRNNCYFDIVRFPVIDRRQEDNVDVRCGGRHNLAFNDAASGGNSEVFGLAALIFVTVFEILAGEILKSQIMTPSLPGKQLRLLDSISLYYYPAFSC